MNESQVFTDALKLASPAERAAYLDAACAGDPELRAAVEALLRAHTSDPDFLEQPIGPDQLGDTQSDPSAEATGAELDFLTSSDQPGSLGRLGHYEVQEVVGRGGMGVVVKAFDSVLHRVVAVKVMAPQLATSATARRRFIREARAAAAVTHDHVVTIHAVEESGPLPHIVMQYVAGASLQERLDRTGPLPLPEILRIGMQAAAGLAAAHAQGLVHRDIKPANILLENGVERVKLTDFGLARAAADASLTQSGMVAGTPSFMSPEQAEGKAVDHRSDLFSLGSVLYAMCTGRPPFRAGTSMGVLKRVCEDAPTQIRETNPEIPDWLAVVVEKLHAKDPAARFQSAAEVAALLGQHLAHVQRPSAVPAPMAETGRQGDRETRRQADSQIVSRSPCLPVSLSARRRWAVAALVVVALVAMLGSMEATGVTSLQATILRVFTPDGTLVVATDDPSVRVTVEGDGGLSITGAGLEEIRLRPGSYRVFADRDGKRLPLEKELVTVSRGGHEIVRVKVESPSAPTAISETGPFVLLDLRKERKFGTLAEAVQGASDGDVIEIHGNGPFVTPPITIRGRALTLRPGAGYRPVLRLSATAVKAYGTLLETDAPLALEGLELQIVGGPGPKTGRVPEITRILRSHEAPLFVAFCRFLVQGEGSGISMADAPACEVYHSEFYSTGGLWWRLGWKPPRHGGRLIVASNLFVGGGEALALWNDHADLAGASIKLVHNNFATGRAVTWFLSRLPGHGGTAGDAKTFQVHAAENLFDPTDAVFHLGQPAELPVQTQALTAEQAQALLPKWLAWTEARNVYRPNLTFLRLTVDGKEIPAQQPVKDLSAWKKLWSLPTLEALQGPLRYDRTVELPVLLAEGVRPADFRLHPDSTGKGAGIMGNDSGANVELVGPGAPYETWKQTPAYQKWLADTVPRRQLPPPAEIR